MTSSRLIKGNTQEEVAVNTIPHRNSQHGAVTVKSIDQSINQSIKTLFGYILGNC